MIRVGMGERAGSGRRSRWAWLLSGFLYGVSLITFAGMFILPFAIALNMTLVVTRRSGAEFAFVGAGVVLAATGLFLVGGDVWIIGFGLWQIVPALLVRRRRQTLDVPALS